MRVDLDQLAMVIAERLRDCQFESTLQTPKEGGGTQPIREADRELLREGATEGRLSGSGRAVQEYDAVITRP